MSQITTTFSSDLTVTGVTSTQNSVTITVNPVVQPPPNGQFKFIWFTDIHVGKTNTYDPGQLKNLYDKAALLCPDSSFVIASGDITEWAKQSEFDAFEQEKTTSALSSKQWYFLPGNHDEIDGVDSAGDVPGVANYARYDAHGYPRRWSFVQGGYKFIGYTSFLRRVPDPLHGFGDVSAADLTFVQTELANKGTVIPFMFTHYGISNTLGNNIKGTSQTQLMSIYSSSGVKIHAHGHRHLDYRRDVENGINHINGECVAYSQPNVQGGFMVVTVDGLNIKIETYKKNNPWALRNSDSFTLSQ